MKPLKAIEVFMFSAQSDLDLQDINLFGQKPKKKKKNKTKLCLCLTALCMHNRKEKGKRMKFEIEGQ